MATLTEADNPICVLSRPAPGKALDQVYLEVDAAESENHESTNTITDHPVERGANISDHSRAEPEVLSAECIISNTPLSKSAQKTAVSAGGFQFHTTAAGEVKIGDVNGAAQKALDKLYKLKNEAVLLTVVTAKRTYRSMLIQSLRRVETVKTYDSLAISITFKQVVIVSNKLTTTRVSTDRRVPPKKKKGQQTAVPDEDLDSAALKLGKGGVFGKSVQAKIAAGGSPAD